MKPALIQKSWEIKKVEKETKQLKFILVSEGRNEEGPDHYGINILPRGHDIIIFFYWRSVKCMGIYFMLIPSFQNLL